MVLWLLGLQFLKVVLRADCCDIVIALDIDSFGIVVVL